MARRVDPLLGNAHRRTTSIRPLCQQFRVAGNAAAITGLSTTAGSSVIPSGGAATARFTTIGSVKLGTR
jgi:uncharacterized Zn-binding protein involved in type VI secretion